MALKDREYAQYFHPRVTILLELFFYTQVLQMFP